MSRCCAAGQVQFPRALPGLAQQAAGDASADVHGQAQAEAATGNSAADTNCPRPSTTAGIPPYDHTGTQQRGCVSTGHCPPRSRDPAAAPRIGSTVSIPAHSAPAVPQTGQPGPTAQPPQTGTRGSIVTGIAVSHGHGAQLLVPQTCAGSHMGDRESEESMRVSSGSRGVVIDLVTSSCDSDSDSAEEQALDCFQPHQNDVAREQGCAQERVAALQGDTAGQPGDPVQQAAASQGASAAAPEARHPLDIVVPRRMRCFMGTGEVGDVAREPRAQRQVRVRRPARQQIGEEQQRTLPGTPDPSSGSVSSPPRKRRRAAYTAPQGAHRCLEHHLSLKVMGLALAGQYLLCVERPAFRPAPFLL
jgi:hypothetical protein